MVRLLSGLVLLLAVSQAIAGKPAVFSTGDGAIRGYDPVAFFKIGAPTRGSDAFTTTWQGTTWKFSSAENRDRFEADPTAFAPRYGGYCAYAVSKGATASTEPEAWSIVDGKLYLNYSVDIRQRWRQDTAANIKAADSNWPKVLQR
jgi:hypothetical protein